MNERFREILDGLPDATPRSCLEPYKELIQELRHRKRSYREIARVLAENCGLRVSHSTLHEFVQRHLVRQSPAFAEEELRPFETKAPQVEMSTSVMQSEIRQRINALRRKPAPQPNNSTEFRFDDSEALRLKPGKT